MNWSIPAISLAALLARKLSRFGTMPLLESCLDGTVPLTDGPHDILRPPMSLTNEAAQTLFRQSSPINLSLLGSGSS